MPPHILRKPDLVAAIEQLGYLKTFGNRWERAVDERRVAAVDLLVPAYTSRARHTVRIGDIVTTEVPGLADSLRRPSVPLPVELRLLDGNAIETTVVLPDSVGFLAVKVGVSGLRNEGRDAQNVWRCLDRHCRWCIARGVRQRSAALRSAKAGEATAGANGIALDSVVVGTPDER